MLTKNSWEHVGVLGCRLVYKYITTLNYFLSGITLE